MVRVRFAPSPTGMLHIGGLRTALYNELFALHEAGVFILRIEDTDRTRYVPGAVENLLRTLEWAGIKPSEGPYLDTDGSIKQRGSYGPYVQSERLAFYREHAEKLLETGAAYRCFCSAETLEEMKKVQAASGRPVMYDRRCRSLTAADVEAKLRDQAPFVIRMRVPDSGRTDFTDAIRGPVSFENALIDDQVLIKSDGYPTYHLANVVDDHLMGITHVIRAEEWLPSTPKHVLLYQAFGWTPPVFAHVPLLLNPDRSKLSKRQGDVAVEDYRKQGYLPEAIVNFVALLGWNPSATQEIYAKDELVREFALDKINKGGAVFNRTKLDWLNREYIKRLPPKKLAELAVPFLVEAGLLKRAGEELTSPAGGPDLSEALERALVLERPRIDKLGDLAGVTDFYFKDPDCDPAQLPGKKSTPQLAADRLTGLLELVEKMRLEDFDDPKALEKSISGFIVEKGWTNGETLWPMRYALTGRTASPSPFEVAWAVGKERTVERLKRAIKVLS